MPRRVFTVDDIISDVRSLTDEPSNDSVDTATSILPALNRGLDHAVDILSRNYPEPFLAYETLTLNSTDQEYELPEQCFEDRILKVEIQTSPSIYQELRQISFSQASIYESPAKAAIPSVYCMVGRNIRFLPGPSGTFNARIWFMRNPDELVQSQGRITAINTAGNYVIVDGVGPDVSTESDTLESYVNIVDGSTGLVKWSGQVQVVEENQVVFRSSPIRSEVVGRDISGVLPETIGLDDYICNVRGTCVPQFGAPLSNFLIQFAVADVTRSLGGDVPLESEILDKFEKTVRSTWAGRPTTKRVNRRSSAWGTLLTRWWLPRSQ
jgi:hypothetical protein